MKNPMVTRIVLLLLFASTAFAQPETKKNIVVQRGSASSDDPHFHRNRLVHRGTEPVEMEKVAYLGVETMPVEPTVAAQLGLPRGTGVVVRRVAEESPAENVLQPHDILTKLDDQILVNMAQLGVLVRNHKIGDEVKLTYLRGGKESSVAVKLGEREVPKFAWENAGGAPIMQVFGHHLPAEGANGRMFTRTVPAAPGALATPALPATEAGDVMELIGRDRRHWFAQPRVHVLRRAGGMGSTILDLSAGNFVFSDDEGSVEVIASDGKRELTVKDKEGKVTFQGSIGSPEELGRLPAEVRARIDAIGGADLGDEAGNIEIETKLFDPATKIRFNLAEPRAGSESGPEPGMRTL